MRLILNLDGDRIDENVHESPHQHFHSKFMRFFQIVLCIYFEHDLMNLQYNEYDEILSVAEH